MLRVLLGMAAGVLLVEALTRKDSCLEKKLHQAAESLGDTAGEMAGRAAAVLQKGCDHFQARFDEWADKSCSEETQGAADPSAGI